MSEQEQTTATTDTPQQDPYAGMSTRDRIRAKAANPKLESRELTFLGEKVVLREPPLNTVLDMQQEVSDNKSTMVRLMINYVYTPEGEPVFEEGDQDMIMNLPFTKEIRELTGAIQEMMGVQATEATKSEVEE